VLLEFVCDLKEGGVSYPLIYNAIILISLSLWQSLSFFDNF